jgi:hypothetical protein
VKRRIYLSAWNFQRNLSMNDPCNNTVKNIDKEMKNLIDTYFFRIRHIILIISHFWVNIIITAARLSW